LFAFPSGLKLGSDEIVSVIEKGGMGEVYQARDSKVQRFQLILGKKDRRFKWLKRSIETREDQVPLVEFDPILDTVHADPRFETIAAKLHFPK